MAHSRAYRRTSYSGQMCAAAELRYATPDRIPRMPAAATQCRVTLQLLEGQGSRRLSQRRHTAMEPGGYYTA